MQPVAPRDLSRRYFAKLSDNELFVLFRERRDLGSTNNGRANREVRRRAARAGMPGPYDWLRHMAARRQELGLDKKSRLR